MTSQFLHLAIYITEPPAHLSAEGSIYRFCDVKASIVNAPGFGVFSENWTTTGCKIRFGPTGSDLHMYLNCEVSHCGSSLGIRLSGKVWDT